ncbi:MAG TPA: DUF397 domain-containing protein [Streptosporangiaceae bacterium]|nr:DUF397 domain-containing protein [Streptosporangiaceae bacterium]
MNNADLAQLTWFKSSKSYANGACITCARLPEGGMAVKDSKHPDGPALQFSPATWQTFAETIKRRPPR